MIAADPIDGVCPPGQWLCGDNSTCIFENQRCNGQDDCPKGENSEGGDDEAEDECSCDGSGDCLADDAGNATEYTTIMPSTSTMGSSAPIEEEGPDVSTKGWYPGDEQMRQNRDDFDRLDCRRHFLQPKPSRLPDAVPAECMRILKSISFLTFQGAHLRMCGCHQTGSRESMCDKYYGGCLCKNLVVGRRCDSCAPASYGFSALGCTRYQKNPIKWSFECFAKV